MISILLDAVSIGFEEATANNGDGIKVLVVTDEKSGVQVRVPFDPTSAKLVAAHLDGRPTIQVAKKLP